MSGMHEIVSVLANAVVALYGDRLSEDDTVESVTTSLLEHLSGDKPLTSKKEVKKPVKSVDTEDQDTEDQDLDKLGKKELIVIAKKHNIPGVSSLKVDDLRAKIRDVLVNGAPTKIPKSNSGATADHVGDAAAKSDLKASKLVEKVAAKNEDPTVFVTADKSLKEFVARMNASSGTKLTNVLINPETGLVVHNKADGRVAIGRLVGSKLVDLDDKCRALCKKNSIKVELLNATVSSAKSSAAADSESESDSDDVKPAPVKKPAPPKKPVPVDESEAESEGDSPVPVAKKPAPVKKPVAPVKKPVSESESDDEAPVKKPAAPVKKPVAPVKKPVSESESDDEAPVKKPAAPVKKPAPVSPDSVSESPVAKPVKKPVKKPAPVESDSESDSPVVKKPAVKKPAVKKSVSSDSD